jgi:hypothetical protein
VCVCLVLGETEVLMVCWPIKLLVAFANAVIPGCSLRIHDQDFYYLLDMYVFRNGASFSMKEGSVFLCMHYVCCTVVSARVYLHCHSI